MIKIRINFNKKWRLPYRVDVLKNGVIVNSGCYLFRITQSLKIKLEQAKIKNNKFLIDKYAKLLAKAQNYERRALQC